MCLPIRPREHDLFDDRSLGLRTHHPVHARIETQMRANPSLAGLPPSILAQIKKLRALQIAECQTNRQIVGLIDKWIAQEQQKPAAASMACGWRTRL